MDGLVAGIDGKVDRLMVGLFVWIDGSVGGIDGKVDRLMVGLFVWMDWWVE